MSFIPRLFQKLSTPTILGRIVLAAVLCLVAGVYAQAVTFQFLPFWDDDTNIHRNPLYAPLSPESVLMFWKGPFQQLYIPVTYSAWASLVALSRVIAGTSVSFGPINAALFHGANVLAHLLAVAMVFMIVRRLLSAAFRESDRPPRRVIAASAVGALAFGLHPVQVETVAWVSGLRDLLGGALALVALEMFLSWLDRRGDGDRRNWLRYASATVFLLLAFGSKPGSVVTPALALLCGAWLLHAKGRGFASLLWLLPWFLFGFAEVVMTSHSQPAAELARSLVPMWARPLVACDALAFYLWKLFWPFGLCADYGRSPNSLLDAGVLFWSWSIPVALTVLLAWFKRLRIYLIPCALLALGVLPTLGLIPFNFQVVSTVSDRYLYLAMLGPALALALFVSLGRGTLRAIIAGMLLLGWTVLSLLQLPEWREGATFFPATLSRNPTSWKSRHNYACTLDAQGKLPEALVEFTEAIRLRPSNAEAHNDMALTLLRMGRRQEAILSFQNSLQVRATTGAARNLAATLLLNGQPAAAAQIYRLAMKIDPSDIQNQRALAWLLATHPDDHVRDGREAVELSKQIVTATNGQAPLFLLTLAASLAEAGDFSNAATVAAQAEETYRRAGDPGMAQVIAQRILPALRNRQTVRDDPFRAP
jgi:tetratricopeptide (TPR) repeat protein